MMRFFFLCLFACSLSFGCGATSDLPPLAIHVGQLQDDVTAVTLWVLKGDFNPARATSCQDILNRTVPFNSETFGAAAKASKIIPLSASETRSSLEQVPPDTYLFVVGGYRNSTITPENLRYIGCQEGKVEVGKKTPLSIFLAKVEP